MLEHFRSYWLEQLPREFTTGDAATLIGGVFCLTFLTVVVLHAFIPGPQPVTAVLLHALSISTTYAMSIVFMVGILMLFKLGSMSSLQVWQLWIVSFITYIGGFYLSPVSDMLTGGVKFELHADLSSTSSTFHFIRLTPVWALITYLFVVVMQKRGLLQELDELAQLNQKLKLGPHSQKSDKTIDDILLTSGKKETLISPKAISHISVEDHYCYVYHLSSTNELRKVDISQPLSRIQNVLPDEFIKVHRSHIVNVGHVSRIEKKGRNYTLSLCNDSYRIPISRSHLQKVLPVLHQSFSDQRR